MTSARIAEVITDAHKMAEYSVSYMVVYSDTVEAESPEEAADMVQWSCPYDVDGLAYVVNEETGEEWEL